MRFTFLIFSKLIFYLRQKILFILQLSNTLSLITKSCQTDILVLSRTKRILSGYLAKCFIQKKLGKIYIENYFMVYLQNTPDKNFQELKHFCSKWFCSVFTHQQSALVLVQFCVSRSNLWPNIRRYGHFNLWSLFKPPTPIPQVVKAGKWENVLSFGFFFRVISPPFLFFHIPPAPIGPLFKSSFFFFLLLLYRSFRLLCCWRIYCATSKVSFWNLYSVIHYFISIYFMEGVLMKTFTFSISFSLHI